MEDVGWFIAGMAVGMVLIWLVVVWTMFQAIKRHGDWPGWREIWKGRK